ncbi:MAG TPA: elongation factor G [Lacipirellulaceae bacterium]|nr:elongation factor G [Lacipirellulaceae bacterium]
MARKVEDIRNVAICGHGSAGKTTLVDHLLVKTGAVTGQPSVDNGTSVCDFDEEEKHHKHSIEASIVHFDHAGVHFNMIDTPGYPDLIGQTVGALRAVETVLIAIDAHAGIKVNTRRVWEEAGNAGLGRIICITKLDADNINFEPLIDAIKEVFGSQCALFNVPIGHGHDLKGVVSTLDVPKDTAGALIDPASLSESVMESIIEADEAVMEKYLEGEMPSKEDLQRLCAEAVRQGTLTPIVCVSTKMNVGLDELLALLVQASLPPSAVVRTGKKEGDDVTLKCDPSAPLSAQVFKTRIDPFVQRLSFMRIFSGTLKKDSTVPSPGARKGIKIGPLLSVQGEKTAPVDEAIAGEIVAVAKTEDLHTGTSLGEVELPPIKFPTPMVGLAVAPKARGDETKLSGALHKLTEEDRTVRLDHDQETKEMVLTGMSELHLQLLRERLKRRDKVEVETHEPKIPYRETIQANGEGSYRHKKQSGGSGQFGEVHIRMYPFPEGTQQEEFATKERFPQLKNTHYHEKHNFLWVDTVVGGSIPGNFMPAIEKGFLEKITSGVVAGYPVQNICVEVYFGKDHPVDSNETAFRIAARQVFAKVFRESKPSLLEPIVTMEITVPVGNVGDVSSDLSGRRGQMVGMDSAGGGMTTVVATAPLAEVMTYARTLSSMTGGQGSYTMEFARYDVVPPNIQQQIIAKAKLKEEEE